MKTIKETLAMIICNTLRRHPFGIEFAIKTPRGYTWWCRWCHRWLGAV